MEKTYSLIGSNLFVDQRGLLFAKTAQEYIPVKNKMTEAEDRFVERKLKGVQINDQEN